MSGFDAQQHAAVLDGCMDDGKYCAVITLMGVRFGPVLQYIGAYTLNSYAFEIYFREDCP